VVALSLLRSIKRRKRRRGKKRERGENMGESVLTIYLPKSVNSQREANKRVSAIKKRLRKLGVTVTKLKKTERTVWFGTYGSARIWEMHVRKGRKRMKRK